MLLRAKLTLGLAFAGACSTGTAGPPPGTVDRILSQDGGYVVKQTVNENTQTTVDAPVARVWTALLTAYNELEIAPTDMDRTTGVFGNSGFAMPSRMLKRPATDFFSCGGNLNGMLGNTGRVQASVKSHISAAQGGKTLLVTNVTGRIRSNAGVSGGTGYCDSTGLIEQFLHSEVKRLATAP